MANPVTDIQTLSTAYPIALLPVRIETRFAPTLSPPQLRVRIYPDEVFADFHEDGLTDAEYADGVAYWTEAWTPANEPAAWARIVPKYQAPRAAWIVHQCTPSNIASRPAGSPTFPAVTLRDPNLPGARASGLPTAWVVIAYRGGAEIHRVTSSAVHSPLQVGFRPDLAETDPSIQSYNELKLEQDLAWMIDFNLAVTYGMAMNMPITPTDLTLGFDRVVVLGVRAPLDPLEGAKQLQELLAAHHYTRGLAFVRQGTPTNNTGSDPAGYPPPSDAAYSYPIERGGALAAAGGDGARLALALGVSATMFDHVEGADRHEDANAKQMQRALWPSTLGYFLEQIAAVATPAQVADLRDHVANHLRGRGPYAAFRVGRVPYGVLPVTSLSRWATTSTSAIDVKLPPWVENWRRISLALAGNVQRVGRTSDPDADLLGALALDASAREVRIRETIGPAFLLNMFVLNGISATTETSARANFMAGQMRALGMLNYPVRFAGFTHAPTARRIDRALVQSDALSETEPLFNNYISWLRAASIADLRAAAVPGSASASYPLLFHLLRQASLIELGRTAVNLAIAQGAAVALDAAEVELIHVGPGTETRATPWDRFAAALPAVSGSTPLGTWLLQPSSDAARQPVRDYQAALDALAILPSAELDRLTAETLDTCAYRVDAWVTSLATRKLATLRTGHPTGVHLGAFAWVEDLKPQTTPRPGTEGGFIHAPTPAHAATAAILRSGYLSRTGSERTQVGVNLSSRRVRTALDLVDGVRQGQPLAALLGYRFERALHDAGLDPYVQPFRARFPLGADPAAPTDPASERIPARSVADGLGLRTALAGATTAAAINWSAYPAEIAASDRPAVATCLLRLDDDVDATADVLLAESIYQTVQGNTDRASATLAALAGGATLAEPQIAQVPSTATTFHQRAGVLIGGATERAPGWSATAPRALCNDRLDAWVSQRLGDPMIVRCTISYADPAHPDQVLQATVALADLSLCALDVLDLARHVAPEGGGELDARIAWHAANALSIATPMTISYDRGGASPRDVVAFPELLEVARAIGDALAGARALLPVDLTQDASGPATGDGADLLARASDALDRLQIARDLIDGAVSSGGGPGGNGHLRDGLWQLVGFGIRSDAPPSALGDAPELTAALLAAGRAAIAEADRRIAAIAAAPGNGLAQLDAAFVGQLILPVFVAPNAASVLAAIAGGPAILQGDAFASRRWFEGAARVRAPLGRVRVAALASEAIGGVALDFAVTQLPLGTRWIGLPYDRDPSVPRPPAGTLSLGLHSACGPELAVPWAGLVFDEWLEAIPSDRQMTSFAVNFDAPGAEAAQCVLLAVPPGTTAAWDLDTLTAIVNETAELAHVRAVDLDLLGDWGQFIPTTYIAANIADETISLDLAAYQTNEAVVVEPAE